jgi:hypothetical protein
MNLRLTFSGEGGQGLNCCRLGPWTGSKEGEVGHLRLSLRALLIDQGFVIVYAHVSKLNIENPIGTHGLHPANVECPDCTDRSSRLPTHRQCAVVMTEVDNRECERMETLRQEIENARAAVNRAAGLVKGSKNAEVESWQLLEKLLDEARDLVFEYEKHHLLPGAPVSQSRMRGRSSAD